MHRKVAAWVGVAAVACFAYGLYAASVVQELRDRYGNDDRILIQAFHAVAGCGLGLVVAGWAVHLLRGGTPPTGNFWRGRPGDWSGWMLAVGVAVLVALVSVGYDAGRAAADQYRASGGRGVHGTLTVERCTPQEYGYKCDGTFRADDGSFEVERVTAYPDESPRGELDGWVSGPRPLGMFDGTSSAWREQLIPLGILAALWLALLGFLALVAVRKLRAPSAPAG